MHRGRVRVIVADQMYADAECAKSWVVQRRDVKPAVAPRYENVREGIVGSRRACGPVACRDAENDVAASRVERIASEAAALGPPRVFDALAQVPRDQGGNVVLEPLAARVREGEIVGISAHPQSTRREPISRRPRRASDG